MLRVMPFSQQQPPRPAHQGGRFSQAHIFHQAVALGNRSRASARSEAQNWQCGCADLSQGFQSLCQGKTCTCIPPTARQQQVIHAAASTPLASADHPNDDPPPSAGPPPPKQWVTLESKNITSLASYFVASPTELLTSPACKSTAAPCLSCDALGLS